jgi:putative two-component system response regulator
MARGLGVSRTEVETWARAATLHDIGKICLSARMLSKKGALSAEERASMETHTELGGVLLAGIDAPILGTASDVAWAHHENFDGSGYPRGLRGTLIPLAARVVRLSDCYDALRSERSYKPGFSHQKTRKILFEGDNRTSPEHFDPDLLAVFERHERQIVGLYERDATPSCLAVDVQVC